MLEMAYYLLFVVLFTTILYFFNTAAKQVELQKSKLQSLHLVILAVSICWFTYVGLLSNSNVFLDYSLPPRLPLFLIAPLFLFTGIFLYKKRNSPLLHSIPKHIPIAFQSFRIVIEGLFYFTFLKGILPVEVTFEGYNFDVLIGLSAPIIALLAYKKRGSNKALVAWNISGIIVVGIAAFIFVTSFYFPSFWRPNARALIGEEFVRFPYVILPAFFMPVAVFMHVLSIVQLTKKTQ